MFILRCFCQVDLYHSILCTVLEVFTIQTLRWLYIRKDFCQTIENLKYLLTQTPYTFATFTSHSCGLFFAKHKKIVISFKLNSLYFCCVLFNSYCITKKADDKFVLKLFQCHFCYQPKSLGVLLQCVMLYIAYFYFLFNVLLRPRRRFCLDRWACLHKYRMYFCISSSCLRKF